MFLGTYVLCIVISNGSMFPGSYFPKVLFPGTHVPKVVCPKVLHSQSPMFSGTMKQIQSNKSISTKQCIRPVHGLIVSNPRSTESDEFIHHRLFFSCYSILSKYNQIIPKTFSKQNSQYLSNLNLSLIYHVCHEGYYVVISLRLLRLFTESQVTLTDVDLSEAGSVS